MRKHHFIYVVELQGVPRGTGRDVYVGMTGLAPEERFANHKKGYKASRIVTKYGLRLLPELYEVFNPMPFDVAVAMEAELAEDLRRQGYTVAGGH